LRKVGGGLVVRWVRMEVRPAVQGVEDLGSWRDGRRSVDVSVDWW
jgi:hypothetical protein